MNRLRGETRFNSVDDLTSQIRDDVETTRRVLAEPITGKGDLR